MKICPCRYSTIMHGVKEVPYKSMKTAFRIAAAQRRGLFQRDRHWNSVQQEYVAWRRNRDDAAAQARARAASNKRKKPREVKEEVEEGEEEDDGGEEDDTPRAQRLRRRIEGATVREKQCVRDPDDMSVAESSDEQSAYNPDSEEEDDDDSIPPDDSR
jgi:hypothetical protein